MTEKNIVKIKVAASKRAFLAALAIDGIVGTAAKAAMWSMSTVRYHRDKDPEFNAQVIEAIEVAGDQLEQEAIDGAKGRWLEPVLYKGEPVYERDAETGKIIHHLVTDPKTGTQSMQPKALVINKRSERMLELMLKGTRPDKFRDTKKQIDMNVSGGVAIANMQLDKLPVAAQEQLLAMLESGDLDCIEGEFEDIHEDVDTRSLVSVEEDIGEDDWG